MHKILELFQVFCSPRRWMPRATWDARVRVDECPICEQMRQAEIIHGLRVAELSVSSLMLTRNQYERGYCLLTLREYATELHLLPPRERDAFFSELMRVGAAIAKVFGADKMNYHQLGNLVPHLHWHIVPRYCGDVAPRRMLNPDAGRRLLKQEEYEDSLASLRAALR